jgi:glycosyltransferase involved in cell wall biosynthesis
MKILFISSWYPTKSNPNAGIFVKEHAAAIHHFQKEIVVLAIVINRSKAIFSKNVSDFIDENGVRTILIEINTRFRDIVYHAIPLQYFIVKRIYQKILEPTFNPDIIHSNVIFPAGIIGNWLASYLKKPHIITEHWTRVRNFKEMPVLSFWAKKAYQKSVRILPVSKFLQHEIMESFEINDDNKFKVIGNVVKPDIFFFKEKNQNKTDLKLCAIATWAYVKHPAKQPELLINAISEVQKQINMPIQLTMVGGGNKVNELIELCKSKGVNAIFTGYIGKNEIATQLQNSDFFVHPTLIETFGVVVAEALLTGTPVICSNVTALPELINESNGILCENTTEKWVEGIKLALDSKFNYKQISTDTGNRFSLESIGNLINDVYLKL